MKNNAQVELEMAVGVKRQAIQEFINSLTAMDEDTFIMTSHDMRGAHDLIGWWAIMEEPDGKVKYRLTRNAMAVAFGVTPSEISALIVLALPPADGWTFHGLQKFDQLPPAKRKGCMIRVLELLMESGKSEWPAALADVLEPEELAEFRADA